MPVPGGIPLTIKQLPVFTQALGTSIVPVTQSNTTGSLSLALMMTGYPASTTIVGNETFTNLVGGSGTTLQATSIAQLFTQSTASTAITGAELLLQSPIANSVKNTSVSQLITQAPATTSIAGTELFLLSPSAGVVKNASLANFHTQATAAGNPSVGDLILATQSSNLRAFTASQLANYLPVYVDSGSANAYAIAPSPAYTAYFDGMLFAVKISNTNTSQSCTLNVNGLGTKNIYLPNNGSGPFPGALVATGLYLFQYYSVLNSGVGGFACLNPNEVGFSYTGTLTGCTTAPTATVNLRLYPDGNTIFISISGNLTATSNSNSCTITGGPSYLTSASGQPVICNVVNNGSAVVGQATLSNGTIVLGTTNNSSGFTASGSKGFAGCSFIFNTAI